MFMLDSSASTMRSMGAEPRDRLVAPGPSSLLDPVFIARSVWSWRYVILLFALVGLAVAVAFAATTPKIYMATTQILIDPRDIKVVANEVTPNGLPSEATLALIESQTSVILSSNVLSRVVAKASLENDPEFNGQMKSGLLTLLPAAFTSLAAHPDEELRSRELRVIERLRHALTVARETKSFVINLTVASVDPQKAATIANLIAEVFIAEQGRVQSDTARRATDALSSRLSELRQSVVEAEGRVEEYKSQNALIGVGGRLVDDDYIVRINDQLAKARGDITALRVRADSMRTASVEDVVRGTLPEELSSTALVRLRQSYSDLAQQAAILATKLGPRHPQRLASEGALNAARQAIAGELGRIVAAAQTELARAAQTERDLTAQIDDLKAKQVETSGSFVKLRELEREVDASRAVYEAFLLRARETSEQESLNTANVRVISDATPPLEAGGLSRKIIVLAGFVLGFAVGVGLAAFVAVIRMIVQASKTAKRREDLEDRSLSESREPAAVPPVSASPQAEAAETATGDGHPPLSARPTSALSEPLRSSVHEGGDALRRRDGGEAGMSGRYAWQASNPAPVRVAQPDVSMAPSSRPDAMTAERRALRERVRTLSGGSDHKTMPAVPGTEAADIAQDIASIRATIADIRRRKATAGHGR
ncbi:hypothetical protein ASG43_20110 [Aureimonas sp. Leaf454]|uniref:GumC family protein n=1 Tax=Aureimonas sp. Leaf454 TaxID=1736381 RepID=UPI0006F9F642|nr:GumC family protein [Aureimonas sp. Leaf454]KQT52361.1 hypothetical protein ASG43_20110 [Aureimonas sp. Leaf454]